MKVHPTAIISQKAQIHESVEVGPNVIIEDEVRIGAGTTILANAVIRNHTFIGENNAIHYGVIIGHDPQDVAFNPDVTSSVEIGNNNILREYTTVHRGSKEGGKTVIGNDNFILGQIQIAHDVTLGNNITIANFSGIAGYATLHDNAFVSGGVMVHQFVTVGRLAMLSGNSAFSRNIPPFIIGLGRNLVSTINIVGLRRAGISKETIREIKQAYEILFSDKTKEASIEEIANTGFRSPEVQEILDFVRNSDRPLALHYKKTPDLHAV